MKGSPVRVRASASIYERDRGTREAPTGASFALWTGCGQVRLSAADDRILVHDARPSSTITDRPINNAADFELALVPDRPANGSAAVRPQSRRNRRADAFTFKLEHPDGTPADPPTLKSAVPNWQVGDRIPRGPDMPALVVVGLRAVNDPVLHALLVVEAA
jgi:hypothetical protein